MTDTANLALPFIEAAQAQKHVTHNEALRLLDTLVQLAVLDRDLAAAPASPNEGERWIVAAGATGVWENHGNEIAAWRDGAWQFSAPRPGWIAFVVDEGTLCFWNGSAWTSMQSIITGLQNLTLLGVGATADATNPFSATLNNALWTAKPTGDGGTGDLRYTLSKEAAGNTLSLLLQTNFSGRAEIGLTGDDDLHLKVSADGTLWREALTIDRASGALGCLGQIRFPSTQNPSADPNTLDDYEEGTFQPVFTALTTAPGGVGYSNQSGRYTKIGRLVLVEGRMTLTSKGSGGAGQAALGNLPFTAASIGFTTQLRYQGVTLPAGTILSALVQGNTLIFQFQSNSGAGDVNWPDIGDSFDVIYSVAYSV